MGDVSDYWWYVGADNKTIGPESIVQMYVLYITGQIHDATYVVDKKVVESWTPISSIEDLSLQMKDRMDDFFKHTQANPSGRGKENKVMSAKLRVKEGRSGLDVVYTTNGWMVTGINSNPGQPNVEIQDSIIGIGQASLMGLEEAQQKALFKEELCNDAELLIVRKHRTGPAPERKRAKEDSYQPFPTEHKSNWVPPDNPAELDLGAISFDQLKIACGTYGLGGKGDKRKLKKRLYDHIHHAGRAPDYTGGRELAAPLQSVYIPPHARPDGPPRLRQQQLLALEKLTLAAAVKYKKGDRVVIKNATWRGQLGTLERRLPSKAHKWGIKLDTGKRIALPVAEFEMESVSSKIYDPMDYKIGDTVATVKGERAVIKDIFKRTGTCWIDYPDGSYDSEYPLEQVRPWRGGEAKKGSGEPERKDAPKELRFHLNVAESAGGRRGGSGVRFIYSDDGWYVKTIAPHPGQPYLREGDCVIKINGQELRGRPERIQHQVFKENYRHRVFITILRKERPGPAERERGWRPLYNTGSKTEARWEDGKWYPGIIQTVNTTTQMYRVYWPAWGNYSNVKEADLRDGEAAIVPNSMVSANPASRFNVRGVASDVY